MPTSQRPPTRFALTRALLLSFALVGAASGLEGADAPGRMRIGKPHRLKVTHTTRVKVAVGTARLDVWQAKPLPREWPGLKAPLVAESPTLSPAGGKETPTRSEGGLAWSWRVADPAVGEADYVSAFEIKSADRELKTSGLVIRWTDLATDTTELMKGLPPLPTANETVRAAVAEIRKKGKDVIDALTAFSQWVNTNIAYTPGVSYGRDDLDAICRGRGGHCGHRATVFLAFCQAAGVPARKVCGYALLNKAGGGIGALDSNRHVWVEVNLPNLGWVEMEPAPHGSPFAIGYLFVLCPRDLQSCFVEANTKAGVRSEPLVSDTVRVEEVK